LEKIFYLCEKLWLSKNFGNMNINELFELVQDNLDHEEMNGELIIQGNCIIWSCNINSIDDGDEDDFSYDEEDVFSFESSSNEEKLNEYYSEDLETIQRVFDELGEYDNWSFSDPEIIDDTISFKVF